MRFLILAALTLLTATPARAAALTPAFEGDTCTRIEDAPWRAFLGEGVVAPDKKCDPPLAPITPDPLAVPLTSAPASPGAPLLLMRGTPDAQGLLVAAQQLHNPVEEDPYLPPTDSLLLAGWAVALLLVGWGIFRALLR